MFFLWGHDHPRSCAIDSAVSNMAGVPLPLPRSGVRPGTKRGGTASVESEVI